MRAFEQGLTRYRDRVGNLNIPLFYVDENKLPLGRMLSCLYEKWEWDETRGKRETDWSGFEVRETLAEIDSLRDKFFDPGLWPRWKKLRWRIADQVRAKRDNYLDKLPGPVPSLSEIGGTPGTFYVLLYLFLVNKGQVSRPQTETEERLRDIFPWEAFSPEARGNKALGAVLKKCRLQLTTDQEVDPFVQKVILEKLDYYLIMT
ncbi:MAG: hypothetical protein CL661_12055 [Bacteroidetes bacterium]|nr:hypothetical protein [Bacteroidota bacterium]